MIKIATTKRHLGRGVVISQDGVSIEGVLSVNISIKPDDLVIATIDVIVGDIDIDAQEILGMKSLEASAAHHGMKLVKDD